jgi:hypothetical protein
MLGGKNMFRGMTQALRAIRMLWHVLIVAQYRLGQSKQYELFNQYKLC